MFQNLHQLVSSKLTAVSVASKVVVVGGIAVLSMSAVGAAVVMPAGNSTDVKVVTADSPDADDATPAVEATEDADADDDSKVTDSASPAVKTTPPPCPVHSPKPGESPVPVPTADLGGRPGPGHDCGRHLGQAKEHGSSADHRQDGEHRNKPVKSHQPDSDD